MQKDRDLGVAGDTDAVQKEKVNYKASQSLQHATLSQTSMLKFLLLIFSLYKMDAFANPFLKLM